MIPFGRHRGLVPVETAPWDSSWLFRRFKRKGWFFAGAYTENGIAGMAIADVGYLGLAFSYFYDSRTGTYHEERAMRPFAFRRRFLPSLNAPWGMRRGSRLWTITPTPTAWLFAFHGPKWSMELELTRTSGGWSTVAPSKHRPFHSTYKDLCVPGRLAVRGLTRPFELSGPLGAVDFSLGYPPRHTRWNWACLVGTTSQGGPFGLNAVAGFNDDLENALWHGGETAPLGPVRFSYTDPAAPWTLTGESFTLIFKPLGERRENVSFGLIRSRFRQPFGTFQGTWTNRGKAIAVRGKGVVEEHDALW